jgi:hypothetical protein
MISPTIERKLGSFSYPKKISFFIYELAYEIVAKGFVFAGILKNVKRSVRLLTGCCRNQNRVLRGKPAWNNKTALL